LGTKFFLTDEKIEKKKEKKKKKNSSFSQRARFTAPWIQHPAVHKENTGFCGHSSPEQMSK
jgi:hypothetical protein